MPRPTKCLLQLGQTIVFEGDSLTSRRAPPCLDDWPYLRLSHWHRTYADDVSEWLFCNRPDLRLTFHNAAVGGSSCAELLDRYERSVKVCRPAWVIMTLGANDSARKIPLRQFRERVSLYCRRLAEDSGGRVMGLAGFKAGPHAPEGSAAAKRRAGSYYLALRDVLRQHNGLYVDVGATLLRKARLLYRQCPLHSIYSDGGHFNAIANQIMTAEVLQALGVIRLAQ